MPELLPFADRVNDALQDCGFPRCSGGVMASNPDWCLSQEEWAQKFADWVNRADGKRLLYATIFFDFRTLYGPPEPVEDLRRWLLGMVHDHRNFFRRMVELALSIRPPLGLFRDFVVQRGGDATHTLDLKLNGITPFVDAGRIFALYAGIGETNTAQRLRAAGTRWRLDPAEIEAWLDGFHHIQFLRLCQHRKQAQQGKSLTNLLAPDDLNELERQFLKEAFLQARKLQRQLEQFFQFLKEEGGKERKKRRRACSGRRPVHSPLAHNNEVRFHANKTTELGRHRRGPPFSEALPNQVPVSLGSDDLLGHLLLPAPDRCRLLPGAVQDQGLGTGQRRHSVRAVPVRRGVADRLRLLMAGQREVRCIGRRDH
jgi:hypothetical protein